MARTNGVRTDSTALTHNRQKPYNNRQHHRQQNYWKNTSTQRNNHFNWEFVCIFFCPQQTPAAHFVAKRAQRIGDVCAKFN